MSEHKNSANVLLHTENIARLHMILNRAGYLYAAHFRRPSEIFVCFGGFKLCLPILKSVKHISTTSTKRQSMLIFVKVFKLLNTLLKE